MEVKIYDRNLSSPTLEADLSRRHERMTFSTRLPGGFHICSFRLKMDLPEGWNWITRKVFYRLVISDGPKTLWEGRIEDISLDQSGVNITAYGYYANLADQPYATAYNDHADDVIKAILTAVCPQISSDQTNIDATDITITSAADASYLDIYPQAIVEKLLAFSDSTNGHWDFAIWEDRVPHLHKRNPTSIDWLARLADFSKLGLKYRGADLWNSSYAVYQAGGAIARTADANDTDSQTRYGDGSTGFIRKYVVPDLGAVVAASAQAARDGWIADHKYIWPNIQNLVLGARIADGNGAIYPSSWIRAGQVIRIRDLVPASVDAGTVTRDRYRTFFIAETEYDVDNRQMRIVPETRNAYLTSLLAKLV